MSSKRFDVVSAVGALIAAAVPAATVKCLEADEAFPSTIPDNGLIIVRNSHPGDPDIDLSVRRYNYLHPIKVEIAFMKSDSATPQQRVDAALVAIGTAVAANRFLGGLCEYLDALPSDVGPLVDAQGAPASAGTVIDVMASYATINPLS